MGSQQKIIKEKIIECLKTESCKEKTTEEIKNYLEEKEVHIDKGTSAIRNALFNLKQENPSIVNVKRGVYVWRDENEKKISDLHKKYDLSDFITITSSKKREDKLMVSVFQDGTFALNTSLQKNLSKRNVEIKGKIRVVSKLGDRNGSNISDAKINLYALNGLSPKFISSKVTDKNGVVIFDNLSEGSYRVIEIVNRKYFEKPTYIQWNEVTINDELQEENIIVVNRVKRHSR